MILKYREKEKRRLCILGDTLLKWAWHVVLRNTIKKDVNFSNSPNTFGMANQCQVAIHSVQQCIDEGETPIHMDAVSAFPTVARSACFDYVKSRGPIYQRAFPLINLLYASKTSAVLFRSGTPIHQFIATTGSYQGCVSGGYMHAFGTIRSALQFSGKICQIWDDVCLLRNPLQIKQQVIDQYRTCHQVLDGPKLRTIAQRSRTSKCTIVHRRFSTNPWLMNE